MMLRSRPRSMVAHVLRVLVAFGALAMGGNTMYDCATLPSGKCYGTTSWTSVELNSPVGTAITYFTPVTLNASDGHMTNELWLLACQDLPACNTLSGWVEAGEAAGTDAKGCQPPANQAHWFWADMRPGQSFFCHDLGPVAQADFGQQASIAIGAYGPPGSNQFFVNGWAAYLTSSPTHVLWGVSTGNSMQQNGFEIGMELLASHAASAGGTANFGPTSFAPPQSDIYTNPTSNGR